MDEYKAVLNKLIDFRDKRDWKQFHDSKNLALAISIEASELNELFLWKTEANGEDVNESRLKEELADILSYCFLLAQKHELNPFEIIQEKIELNKKKYPIEKSKGSSKKYTEL